MDNANEKMLIDERAADIQHLTQLQIRLRATQMIVESMLLQEKDEVRFTSLEALYAQLGETKAWSDAHLSQTRMKHFLLMKGDQDPQLH